MDAGFSIVMTMAWNLFSTYREEDVPPGKDPLFRRIRQHAEKRFDFKPGTPAAERVPAYKEFLRLENEMLLRYHRNGDSGLRVAHAYAIMIDVLIEHLMDFAIATHKLNSDQKACDVTILALGGYGRNELCPKSDIDVMFLYPQRISKVRLQAFQETLTTEMLYPLWDTGLKIGHSSRTTKEAIVEARASVESKNAMMESRRICGSKSLFVSFFAKYRNFYRKDHPSDYLQARLEDQQARRKKYGNSVYMQQPNIKNGVGGLRDYQNILWMSYVHLHANSIRALVKKGFLKDSEGKELLDAYDFLLRTRNELHFRSNRATDVLHLEAQPEIAMNLGYEQKDLFKRVEAFMTDYYGHAQTIYELSKVIERRIAADSQTLSFKEVINSKKQLHKRIDGFLVSDTSICTDDPQIFEQDPVLLIRIFRIAQKTGKSIEPELEVIIRRSHHLIDNKMVESERAARSFRAILQTVGNVAPTLFHMHELGILGRYIPEFGRLTCLVQHEYYHIYTADIHTLHTIKELDLVFAGEGEYAPRYLSALRDFHTPGILYIMLLLHDLGKADGIKGHDARSVEISIDLLNRLQVARKFHEQILFIIGKHMEMARFTLNHDVNDTDTAELFAKQVGTEENLRCLYVHTFCDARGTSHELWNSYKDSLLTALFKHTLDQFQDPEKTEAKRRGELEMMQQRLKDSPIPGMTVDELEAHFMQLPESYFATHAEEEIMIHVRLVHELLKRVAAADSIASLEPVIEWNDDSDQGLTVVTIVTWDRAGLFYKLAGAFTLADLNILSSKILTRFDHITIDTFYLTDASGGVVESEKIRNLFEKAVTDTLAHDKDLTPQILKKAKAPKKVFQSDPSRLQAEIPPEINIYREISLKRTIVEIQATDRFGLLYELAKCISSNGFDITFARVATQKQAAVDVFHIHSSDGDESIESSRLMTLRESISEVLQNEQSRKQLAAG